LKPVAPQPGKWESEWKGNEFADGEVVDFQAPTGGAAGVGVVDGNQSLAPSRRQARRGLIDAMGVLSKCFVEERTFPNRAVDLNGEFSPVLWKNISLHGDQELGGRVGKLPEQRLAPDHHNVRLIGYPTGRADDVLKFVPFHIHGKLPIAPLH